ncbi:bifunctional 4-hydroxy-2-oxoglutarate aldolase/2-dehydro-3-deoxy-phosphogluconate aldolase [Streptacidiphilus sp. PB12-B1b]|uniref:bifunctional 4-hydroxy-2-oxoglutarate aldolase/2-dehydro-3-deoxy-phosphogluconate aldolase n=1 Tax=Streptacidiphilus sp. PB12-B1b TaxID=2705012 RepID=UPI0015F8B886|nr:bifunctional 4-hydroxy-2-oxoglutarate aldolase/2-dehydro-3-deoxy-phosphogluconate aldolase [Streptacidiphilus sp. PB12-B1b]QMU76495.1 bifunctional 4-hydroxy-2-oxoglutarate aldolase/2-dehydro-3-deoxy-phosphogluconate aldolase [Streptacidiphilus sp. PB12-B1b]
MDLLAELTERRVLAIVRADGPERALACIRTLVDAGITALEVSLTTPGALEAVARARARYPASVLIGAGTVLTAAQAEAAAAAQAGFVVTPAITPGARRSVGLGLPLLCGALTPTEVVTALEAGALAVKVFPASVHGPGYLRELLAPLPDAPLIAVGGVDAVTAPQYLAAGARAVAVGSPLLGSAGRGGPLPELAARAAALLAATGAPTPNPPAPAAPARDTAPEHRP